LGNPLFESHLEVTLVIEPIVVLVEVVICFDVEKFLLTYNTISLEFSVDGGHTLIDLSDLKSNGRTKSRFHRRKVVRISRNGVCIRLAFVRDRRQRLFLGAKVVLDMTIIDLRRMTGESLSHGLTSDLVALVVVARSGKSRSSIHGVVNRVRNLDSEAVTWAVSSGNLDVDGGLPRGAESADSVTRMCARRDDVGLLNVARSVILGGRRDVTNVYGSGLGVNLFDSNAADAFEKKSLGSTDIAFSRGLDKVGREVRLVDNKDTRAGARTEVTKATSTLTNDVTNVVGVVNRDVGVGVGADGSLAGSPVLLVKDHLGHEANGLLCIIATRGEANGVGSSITTKVRGGIRESRTCSVSDALSSTASGANDATHDLAVSASEGGFSDGRIGHVVVL
jgi:hypothetical protein